jgi:hypothetical protein
MLRRVIPRVPRLRPKPIAEQLKHIRAHTAMCMHALHCVRTAHLHALTNTLRRHTLWTLTQIRAHVRTQTLTRQTRSVDSNTSRCVSCTSIFGNMVRAGAGASTSLRLLLRLCRFGMAPGGGVCRAPQTRLGTIPVNARYDSAVGCAWTCRPNYFGDFCEVRSPNPCRRGIPVPRGIFASPSQAAAQSGRGRRGAAMTAGRVGRAAVPRFHGEERLGLSARQRRVGE